MSWVVLLEQINVLWHQVFVVLNSHKRSLFLCDLINCTHVRFLFQYAIGLGLRGCHSNVRLGRSCSAWQVTKSVYTGVSEWVTHLHIGAPIKNEKKFKNRDLASRASFTSFCSISYYTEQEALHKSGVDPGFLIILVLSECIFLYSKSTLSHADTFNSILWSERHNSLQTRCISAWFSLILQFHL